MKAQSMTAQIETTPYHIKKPWNASCGYVLLQASQEQVEKWATDPNCIEKASAAYQLEYRQNQSEPQRSWEEAGVNRRPQRRLYLLDTDTEKITSALWIVFVILPVFLGSLYATITAAYR